jgi:hypothetical protein
MRADEIEAAIERAEAKRPELANQQPAARASPKVLSMCRRPRSQIESAENPCVAKVEAGLVMFRQSQYETA